MTDKCPLTEYQGVCTTPIGWVGIATAGDAIARVDIMARRPNMSPDRDGLALRACKALEGWLVEGGQWPRFPALAPQGSVFQRRVWEALLQIPPGQTKTYGDLALALGSSPRAVGGACRRNPIPLFIPCHRVVAANGDGGFAGHTSGHWMDIKRWLLAHE
ncbi:methylated-DNA--[protein]-cysteine S-methyltransferase [Thiolapillus brandeum]|uniref:Methylated-DNA-[protein]-cysteine S-methyltransferase n=1 Tax=Thiolapillus brandeum TaxID=1076588 RepID=A0A7U6GJQ9_9GAMM|nr:methylated-DNA--[protein]-cysteine S-methyltransferase [Thiolapillus brandeum]BAO44863.1 methylated-DNA-[protein]-cysteine S-methyltransferase [Thiolapillus brandeum]